MHSILRTLSTFKTITDITYDNKENNCIPILKITETNETLGGTLHGLIPFIQAGYTHVVYEEASGVFVMNPEEFDDFRLTRKEIDKLLENPPNKPTTVREDLNQLTLYYFDIE
jgi:hypothetical protein